MIKEANIAHRHFLIIILGLGRPKVKAKRNQTPGRNAVATTLRRCHCIISAGESALAPNPVSVASAARESIPQANIKCAKERLSLKSTTRRRPVHNSVLIDERRKLIFILNR